MPIINRGDDHFQAGTYTGNGTSQTITGLRFQPDFVWIKGRSGATDHALYDAVRGVEKRLESNQTDAEATSDGGVTAFTSDGFTVGSLAQVNTNGATYVYWAWKANGTGVTNTSGSITSTVSANTTAGFSVVTADNLSGTSPVTVGHGLGVAPKMVVGKIRDLTSTNWYVYHSSIAASDYLVLNTTAAKATSSNIWDVAPTSTVLTVGNPQNGWAGGTAGAYDYVFYAFAEVAGYSKFGSYTGNGSTDGPFVYCGFRPRYVLIKRTDSTGGWEIHDNARNTYNPLDSLLEANLSDAELAATYPWDHLSNGFKIRQSNLGTNGNGSTYIYAAFAEVPTKFALAR